MVNIVLLSAALLFAFGVLIGSALHTQAVHREYQRIAERVRELRELNDVLADQDEFPVLASSSQSLKLTESNDPATQQASSPGNAPEWAGRGPPSANPIVPPQLVKRHLQLIRGER